MMEVVKLGSATLQLLALEIVGINIQKRYGAKFEGRSAKFLQKLKIRFKPSSAGDNCDVQSESSITRAPRNNLTR